MNVIGWAGLLTLSFSWIWLCEVYGPVPSPTVAVGFALGGVGVLVGCAGLTRRVRPWSSAAQILAAALAAQALLIPGLLWLEACTHEPIHLQPAFHMTLSVLGIESWLGQGELHLQTAGHVFPFPITTEKLGLLGTLLLLAGAVILLCRLEPNRRRLAGKVALLVLVTSCYLWLRLTVLTAFLLEHPDPRNLRLEGPSDGSMRIFFDPLWQWASFLPLVLLLGAALRRAPAEAALGLPRLLTVRGLATIGCLVLAAVAFTGALRYQDPGQKKSGRIVLDDAHSGSWARAGQPLTKDWFGRSSVYNYASLRELLAAYYPIELNESAPYTRESLTDTDVLIIKTPINPFLDEELEAIVEFVENGGGLLIIGDHTNLLGMSTNANRLASRFGMTFNLDACNQLHDGQFHGFSSSLLCSHPASRRVQDLEFMTSCTLSVPVTAEPVLVTRNSFSDRIDYKRESFFGNVIPDAEDTMGTHVVSAARKIGHGRVMLFGDSTIFSSFGVMQKGRPELVLGMIDYLNRKNDGGYRGNYCFLGAAMVAFLIGLGLAMRMGELRNHLTLTLPVALAVGALAGAELCNWHQAVSYPVPQPIRDLTTVAFVEDVGRMAMPPALAPTTLPEEKSFDTLFITTQRLGLFPRLATLEDAREDDATVLVNPWRSPSAEQLEELTRYVERGGRLLVMDSIYNPGSTANQYLEPFGFHIGQSIYQQPNDVSSQLDTNVTFRADAAIPTLAIAGGGPLFVTDQGHTFVSFGRFGSGIVVAVVDSAMFSRQFMGHPDDELAEDDVRREVYETVYGIFEDCLFGEPTVTSRTALRATRDVDEASSRGDASVAFDRPSADLIANATSNGEGATLLQRTSLNPSGIALLHVGLDGRDAVGCGIYVHPAGEYLLAPIPSPILLVQATTVAGEATYSLPLPNDTSMLGVQAFVQGVNVNGPITPIELSNALGILPMQ